MLLAAGLPHMAPYSSFASSSSLPCTHCHWSRDPLGLYPPPACVLPLELSLSQVEGSDLAWVAPLSLALPTYRMDDAHEPGPFCGVS